MLVYIEYISRRPGISLEAFHKVMSLGQGGWASDHADDVVTVMMGRTWRIGPEPEYMAVWYTKDYGLDRLDGWEGVFHRGEADALEEPFRLAARIDKAGCYQPLMEPVTATGQRFYTEFFDVAPGAGQDDVKACYAQRADRQDGAQLILLLDRIGTLGPDPRGLAVWQLPQWASLEGISREMDGTESPLRPVTAGLYATLGTEIL